MRTMTSVEAQNRFGELLDAAQREPISISRRGRQVAIVLSQQQYDALSQESEQMKSDFNEWKQARKEAANKQSSLTAAQVAIAAFRSSGPKGTSADLLQDRQTDRLREQ